MLSDRNTNIVFFKILDIVRFFENIFYTNVDFKPLFWIVLVPTCLRES